MYRDLGIPSTLPTDERAPTLPEKRRFPRRQLSVRCWMADGKSTIYARVHDVSLGGLCIHAPVTFSVHAELDLTLVLSDRGDSSSVEVRAKGRVVWVRSREGGQRLGAQFTDFVEGESVLSALIA